MDFFLEYYLYQYTKGDKHENFSLINKSIFLVNLPWLDPMTTNVTYYCRASDFFLWLSFFSGLTFISRWRQMESADESKRHQSKWLYDDEHENETFQKILNSVSGGLEEMVLLATAAAAAY